MSAMQRTKGADGEREIAGILAEETGYHIRRRVRNDKGDSDLTGIPGWSIEVKRHKDASHGDIAKWWEQAVAQAAKEQAYPVLFYRADRQPWRAVFHVGMVLASGDLWRGYDWTLTTSPKAWAAVMRESVTT